MNKKGCGAKDTGKNGVTSETLLVMSGLFASRYDPFSNSNMFELCAVSCFCIAAAALDAAKHETDPSIYETMCDITRPVSRKNAMVAMRSSTGASSRTTRSFAPLMLGI